jgi:hypothetical protein
VDILRPKNARQHAFYSLLSVGYVVTAMEREGRWRERTNGAPRKVCTS